MRSELVRTLAISFVSGAAILVASSLSLILIGPRLSALSLFGAGVSDWSNTLQIWESVAPVLFAISAAVSAGIFVFLRWIRGLVWPTLGTRPLDPRHYPAIEDGVNAQLDRLAYVTSWPDHIATASAAPAADRIDFGDAKLTVGRTEQKTIRRFVGSAQRIGEKVRPGSDLIVITGEPGAGKSVLLQEIHASLARGFLQRRHFLLPVVLFAGDITVTDINLSKTSPLPPMCCLLVMHLRRSTRTADHNFAEYLENHWYNTDILVLIDGLDEIGQRTSYEYIQRSLRDFVSDDQTMRRAGTHRFILSCRVEDDIAVFHDALKVLLTGLRGETERRKFCAAVIRSASDAKATRDRIATALTTSSGRLSSAHVFRRNPYFLSILIAYFHQQSGKIYEQTLDFRYLMERHIDREIERPHTYIEKSDEHPVQFRRTLRADLEPIATPFLHFFAFHTASSTTPESLYGKILLNRDVLTDFHATVWRLRFASPQGVWSFLLSLLSRLSDGPALSAGDISAFSSSGILTENDIRLLDQLASKIRGGNFTTTSIILESFGPIAHQQLVENHGWYEELASRIGILLPNVKPKELLSAALFARGLAAAQILRLVYIEQEEGSIRVRFRHRRLAEYFGARYYADNWDSLQPLRYSAWLVPILNLVCAIEGPECRALSWLAKRATAGDDLPTYEWRHAAVCAAEAAAFSSLGAKYTDVVSGLVAALIGKMTWQNDTARARNANRDLVTELTAIRALALLSEVGSATVPLGQGERSELSRHERVSPPQWFIHTARASRAIEKLTARKRPIFNRALAALKLIGDPGGVVDRPAEAWKARVRTEYFVVICYIIMSEAALLVTSFLFGAILLSILASLFGADGSRSASLALYYGTTCSCVYALARLQSFRSPASAVRLNGLLISAAAVVVSLVAIVIWFIVSLIYKIVTVGLDFKNILSACKLVLRWLRRLFSFGWEFYLRLLLTLGAASAIAGGLILLVTWVSDSWTITPKVHPTKSGQLSSPVGPEKSAAKNDCSNIDAALGRVEARALAAPSDLAGDTLIAERRAVARELTELRIQNEDRQCGYKLATGAMAPEAYAADRVMAINPLLVPLPDAQQPPVFKREDWARLRAAEKAPPAPAAKNKLLEVLGEAGLVLAERDREDKLRDLVNRLRNGLRSGRVEAETAQGDLTVGATAATVLTNSESLLYAAAQQRRLREKNFYSNLYILIAIIPIIFLATRQILISVRRRRDKRELERLAQVPIADVCSYLISTSTSEWLRDRIKRIIFNRADITDTELELLDITVSSLLSKNTRVDEDTAMDLSEVVDGLQNRLAHRL